MNARQMTRIAAPRKIATAEMGLVKAAITSAMGGALLEVLAARPAIWIITVRSLVLMTQPVPLPDGFV